MKMTGLALFLLSSAASAIDLTGFTPIGAYASHRAMPDGVNYVGEKPADPLTFAIYPDTQGKAQASLYEDDGVSPAYRNGVYRRTSVAYAGGEVDVSAPEGSYQPGARELVFTMPNGGKPGQIHIH